MYFTVEQPRGYPTVVTKRIDIHPDGTLGPGLPMEFFGADVLEALEMIGDEDDTAGAEA